MAHARLRLPPDESRSGSRHHGSPASEEARREAPDATRETEDAPRRVAVAPGEDRRRVLLRTCVDAESGLPLAGVPVRHIAVTRESAILAEDLGQSGPDGKFRVDARWIEQAIVAEVFVGGAGWCLRRAWFDDVRPGATRDLGAADLAVWLLTRDRDSEERDLPHGSCAARSPTICGGG